MIANLKIGLLAVGIFGAIIVGSLSPAFAAPAADAGRFAIAAPAKDVVSIRWRHGAFDFAGALGLDRMRSFFRHHRIAHSHYYRVHAFGPLPGLMHRRFWRHFFW
jgi:hypothetical protein